MCEQSRQENCRSELTGAAFCVVPSVWLVQCCAVLHLPTACTCCVLLSTYPFRRCYRRFPAVSPNSIPIHATALSAMSAACCPCFALLFPRLSSRAATLTRHSHTSPHSCHVARYAGCLMLWCLSDFPSFKHKIR